MSDATINKAKAISSLKNRADFLRLNKSGDKWISQSLILQTAPNEGQQNTMRFGLTITKKTFKSAVKRNRIKRRLRALANSTLKTHAQSGHDYVLIGRPATLETPYAQLEKDLLWCLKRIGRRA